MSGEHDDREPGAAPDDPAPGDPLEQAVRERAEQVPPEVAQRLGQMRRAAVAELDRREARSVRRRSPGRWVGGLAAAAAAVALTVALLLPQPGDPGPDALLLADAEELEAIAELEVLEELEFLAWLEQEQLDAGQG